MAEQGGSHHRQVHSNTTFDNTNGFDDLLQFNDSEFNMFNLPIVPSLWLSPPLVASDEIDEAVAMDVIDSLSPPPAARVNTWKSKRIQADNIEQLAICERNTAAMIARNNELRRQLATMQQQLQQVLATNEALNEEIRYSMERNRQSDAEMADDPDYDELISQFSSQLVLHDQFPNPSSQD